MARVVLLHWHADEVLAHAARMRLGGHEVTSFHARVPPPTALLAHAPEAFVVSLDRMPSRGRYFAANLRKTKATRAIPIVFVGGTDGAIALTRGVLPDATYARWATLEADLPQIVATSVPADPVVPATYFGQNTSLASKLGVRAHDVVALEGADPGWEAALEPLPEGVLLVAGLGGPADLTLWFVTDRAALRAGFGEIASRAPGLWVAYPKKASNRPTDLDFRTVQQAGLAVGLVEIKVCALDETWTALRFARRRG